MARVFAFAALMVVAIAGWNPTAVQAADERSSPELSYSVESIHWFLRSSETLGTLRENLHRWKRGPVFLNISTADILLEALRDDRILDVRSCVTVGYKWGTGSHDRNRIAGRAAWALEEFFELKLSPVRPDSMSRELHQTHEDARRLVQAFRSGAMRLADERNKGHSFEVLRAKYAGKIKLGLTGPEAAPNYHRAMAQLLEEWFPLGKKLSEFEALAGTVGERKDNHVLYTFDAGYSGWQYQIKTDDGVIVSVVILALD
jgi:hypothetical protein